MAKCECTDFGCPVCKGVCTRNATMCLKRVDMEDLTGTLFCNKCGDDAIDSGLYYRSISGFINATRKIKY